jgi:EEF1A N-terminal glycine/lysine methyltransferase
VCARVFPLLQSSSCPAVAGSSVLLACLFSVLGHTVLVPLVRFPLTHAHALTRTHSITPPLPINLLHSHPSVLELGAGAALPSLVAAYNDAALVVATDYPDEDLLENIRFNIAANSGGGGATTPALPHAPLCRGYIWGADPTDLLSLLPTGETAQTTEETVQKEKEEETVRKEEEGTKKRGFDLIIMSDLVFNHTQHTAMLNTCLSCLSEQGVGLVAFTHHRPHLQDRDLKFLATAAEAPFSFTVQHLFDYKMVPMFAEDPGSVEVRSTVHVYTLRR